MARILDNVTRPEPSRRERHLLEGLAAGMSDQQIADRVGLKKGTVKVYLSHLRHKFPGFSRYTACQMLAEEDRRKQAIKFSRWYGKFGYQLTDEAQQELRAILGECLKDLFRLCV